MTNEVVLTIVVPSTFAASLNCSYPDTGAKKREWDGGARGQWHCDMEEVDPEYFKEMMNTIQSTVNNPNAIHITKESRTINEDFLKAVANYNRTQPADKKLDLPALLRYCTPATYKWTTIGTEGAHKGEEMHEFYGIKIPGFTKDNPNDPDNDKWNIYIKFVTPDNQNVNVISVHRSCDVKPRPADQTNHPQWYEDARRRYVPPGTY